LIKIGNRVLLLSTTLFIPQNEECTILLEVGDDDPLPFIIKFEENKDNAGKSGLNIHGENNTGIITFTNWTSSIGQSTQKPVIFGTTDNKEPLSLIANITKIDKLYKMDIQFMKEAHDD